MKMNVKKLNADAIIPSKGSDYAAGMDMYAYAPEGATEIPAGETCKIHTGIAMEIPNGYFGAVFARSGLATKQGLRPANCVGVIDSDYRGEVMVALHNDSKEPRTIMNGDRVAQLVIMPYLGIEMIEVDQLTDTVRGEGGFGSTGIRG